jgi:hypothetical protein
LFEVAGKATRSFRSDIESLVSGSGFSKLSALGSFTPAGIAGGVASSLTRSVIGFESGGVVPGPIGSPQLAVVHGGEQITPVNQSNSTVTINIGSIGDMVDKAMLNDFFNEYTQDVLIPALS